MTRFVKNVGAGTVLMSMIPNNVRQPKAAQRYLRNRRTLNWSYYRKPGIKILIEAFYFPGIEIVFSDNITVSIQSVF